MTCKPTASLKQDVHIDVYLIGGFLPLSGHGAVFC